MEETELEDGDDPMVSVGAADDVLDEPLEEPFRLPVGFLVAETPSAADLQSDALVSRQLLYLWPGMGWIRGRFAERNTDRRYKIGGNVANWVVRFDGDEADTVTRLYLTPEAHTRTGGDDS